jgi:hypothetical protein
VLLKGKLTGLSYIKVLYQHLLPVMQEYFPDHPCIFQQDNASIHTARDAKEFFHDENLQVLDWPPHSPDLNIIDHVWHYLKEVIAKMLVARNKVELWSHVRKVLQFKRGQEMTKKIQALYESLPRCMKAVIAAHGGNTHY